MKNGVELIADERQEQIEKHGRSIQDDVIVNAGEQLKTAAIAILNDSGKTSYPYGWDHDVLDKIIAKPYIERLVIAGALIAAEIDRLFLIKPVESSLQEENKSSNK